MRIKTNSRPRHQIIKVSWGTVSKTSRIIYVSWRRSWKSPVDSSLEGSLIYFRYDCKEKYVSLVSSTNLFHCCGIYLRNTIDIYISPRQRHNLLTAGKCFESLAKVKYLETTVTNKCWIHEAIKWRLNSRNA